jgi:hypothetical protein
MTSAQDPWHFARPELAQAYLQGFDLGLSSARGLFARRRMGKTQFLKQDLLPAARAAGFLTVYVNLWEDTEHPGQALAGALLLSAKPKGFDRFWQGLTTPVKSIKAGAKLPLVAEGTLEVGLDQKEAVSMQALQQALLAVDGSKQRLLLVIDEAQVLALPQHRALAHALRAGLDTRKANIKVLFAGSSEAALREMFSRAAAPFFNWAALEPFPLLGREFVLAMVRHASRIAKTPLTQAAGLEAFEALKQTPEFFRWYLERYLIHPHEGHAGALEHTRQRIQDDGGFAKAWKDLQRSDRAVLVLAARGVQDFYSAASQQQLSELLGEPQRSDSTLKSAMRRLTGPKLQMLARIDHGAYRFEDPEFESWVKTRRTVD